MKREPIVRAGWCDPPAPWAALGFRSYAPPEGQSWPLVVLGAEVAPESAARAARDPLSGMEEGSFWPMRSPLAWQGARGEDTLLRFAHQCGGDACLQRYVVGFGLAPTPTAHATLARALAEASSGALPDDPLRAEDALPLATLARIEAAVRELGLSCDASYPHVREAFLPLALPEDGVAAARCLAPLVEDALPADLDALRRPPSALWAYVRDRRWTLFVLGLNGD